MTIQELKQKMAIAEAQMANIIQDLQTEDVEVVAVEVKRIEVTNKDDRRPRRYLFKVDIETKIRNL